MSVSQSGVFSPSEIFSSFTPAEISRFRQSTNSVKLNLASWFSNSFARWTFNCCLMAITSVSAYDTWLVYRFRCVIDDLERNPICLALIELDPESLLFFIAGKALGTLIVLASLTAAWKFTRRVGLASALGVAIFQLGLLFYLTMTDFDFTRLGGLGG